MAAYVTNVAAIRRADLRARAPKMAWCLRLVGTLSSNQCFAEYAVPSTTPHTKNSAIAGRIRCD